MICVGEYSSDEPEAMRLISQSRGCGEPSRNRA
jgi:hypothetical protein